MQKKFCLDEKYIDKVANFIVELFIKRKTLLLFGELGSGKTSLVKEIGRSINIKDNISSPSYNLLNIYDSDYGEIYHYDFYRLNNKEELLQLDFHHALENNLTIIEWPEISFKEIKKEIIKINISFTEAKRCYEIFY